MNIYTLTTKAPQGREWQTPIRFFIYDADAVAQEDEYGNPTEYGDLIETDLSGFEEAEGDICFARHTVFDNGVSQICFTKMPRS